MAGIAVARLCVVTLGATGVQTRVAGLNPMIGHVVRHQQSRQQHRETHRTRHLDAGQRAHRTPSRVERAKVIVFHGWDDPFAPPADVLALGRELTHTGADWQIHAYGHTMHSLAPAADKPEAGIMYSDVAAHRAWASLGSFLAEVFV